MTANLRTLTRGLVILTFIASISVAQDRARRGYRGGGYGPGRGYGGTTDPDQVDRGGVPVWEVDPHFKSDVFTFVRIQYSSRGRGYAWQTDFPDSDLNFTYRLQQLTSLKVDPHFKILELTDDKLFDYPFIYMLEVGSCEFSDEEVVALRRYLLNGGFLMVDDFWGDYAWENFREQMKRVFPEEKQEPVDLPLEHPIFHCVYDLKEKPQVPGIDSARMYRGTNITWERPNDPSTREVHYRAIFDDKGRMMSIICQNTDLGDGWEREGAEEWYFHEFSETKAYPMGINIVVYAMTH
jgi:hypothetical protein